MMQDVLRPPLNDQQEALNRRLFPKTVRLDLDMPANLTAAWVTMQQIGDQHICLLDPGSGPGTHRIRNKSQARDHVKDHLFLPLRRFFGGLIWTALEAGEKEPANASKLLHALRQAYGTTITTEDQRFLIETPAHDVATITGGDLDTGVLNRELAFNLEAHDLVRSALQDSPAKSQPTNTSSEEADGDTSTVKKEVTMPFGRQIPDICLNWLGHEDEESSLAAGGIPFIAMEIKDPNKLSFAEVRRYVCEYDRCLQPSEATEAAFFAKHKVMHIRWMLNCKPQRLQGQPRSFFSNLSRHYEYLFFHRQTYGLFSTGYLGVGMRLDWDHPTEPGQHLYLTLLDCQTNEMVPAWHSTTVRPCTLQSFVAAYGALQLETGLIPMPRFMDALRVLMDGHDLYTDTCQVGSDHEEGTTDPRPNNVAAAIDPQNDSFAAPADAVIPAHLDQFNRDFLSCIKDPRARHEILRFHNVDETKYSIRFPKAELPKILCAAFPLHADLALHDPSLQHLRTKDLVFSHPKAITGISDFEDFDLFK